MSVDQLSFRKTMGCFASGVTVVTARTGQGRPVGLTVNAFSSLSLAPPLVLVCLDHRVAHLEAFRAGPFVVNMLTEAQRDLSQRFAEKREDRFDGVDYVDGRNGVPVLSGGLAWVECETQEVVTGGDHDIIIGAVTHVAHQAAARPLVYFRGDYAGLA
ncbi:flavin reductase family protein [Roseospira goensis]|uniref:Flavin reductase (DIM6/NTAB) family NADH-FMN oxidoreductase RutF n=1 Tax=Roseospira goensis TaxID=391922 RepID=A0A7W6RYL4_9PROT|nr:flavin reductase family protein [Roseospira goensis]MBB4284952.1 flavin reductase (DIM6/NTAB) family NADH-FMN oxidoreductase RutF [Roseospira goensis]